MLSYILQSKTQHTHPINYYERGEQLVQIEATKRSGVGLQMRREVFKFALL
jgi:hypothetical protein